jgi:hypothetical protein
MARVIGTIIQPASQPAAVLVRSIAASARFTAPRLDMIASVCRIRRLDAAHH